MKRPTGGTRLARELAGVRALDGSTLRDVAKATGVPWCVVHRVETGGTPSVANFAKLSKWLGGDLRRFLSSNGLAKSVKP